MRDELDAAHIRVIASETGGTRGRTIRVHVATRRITVREAGGVEHDLVPAMRRRPRDEPGHAVEAPFA